MLMTGFTIVLTEPERKDVWDRLGLQHDRKRFGLTLKNLSY